MTGEQIAQAQAAADNITDRLCHLSDETKQLYDAIRRIDDEAYELSYDVMYLRNMLETDEEENGK